MAKRPELVQFGDLTPAHFDRHPVWMACHIADYEEPWYDETDEETFRPHGGPLPADASEGMMLARADFTLADGTRLTGFLTPAVEEDPIGPLGIMQPQLFLPDGMLGGFWEGRIARDAAAHEAFYRALGKTAADVFPVRCAVQPGLATGVTACVLEGFYSTGAKSQITVTR